MRHVREHKCRDERERERQRERFEGTELVTVPIHWHTHHPDCEIQRFSSLSVDKCWNRAPSIRLSLPSKSFSIHNSSVTHTHSTDSLAKGGGCKDRQMAELATVCHT
jgi:hypothetical protein